MEINPTYVAALITAIAASATAFLIAVLTKEAKISDFRQAWIDQLRNDISELAANM